MSTPAECLYLIDSHSLIFQVFHAIPAMSSPSGVPVNALFGFARDLMFLRNEKKPNYLVCAFDLSGPTFRSELYPDYKAHRPPMDDELVSQIPQIHRLLEALRVPMVAVESYEADDVIATLARAGEKRGLEVIICTSDKDCRQLIDNNTRLFNLRKRVLMGREELQKDWGITPEQVVDFQAMVGDSVDNVPGVPGVGEKTAAKLLQEFGTIEGIMANIERIPGAKRQENLRNAGEIVRLSRSLVRLAEDVPIELEWDKWRLTDPDADKFRALCQEWGFRTLATQVGPPSKPLAVARKPEASEKQFIQGELFPFGANEDAEREETPVAPATENSWQATYHLVDTPAKFDAFFEKLQKLERFALDLETTSLEPRRAEIVGLAFSWQAGEAWYLAVRGPTGAELLDPEATLARLKPILENPRIAKVNQNIKYDLLVLRQHSIALAGITGDSMVADFLLNPGERSHGLDDLSNRYLKHQVIPITDLIGKGKKQLNMDEVPTAKVAEYSGEDADVAWRLSELVEGQLQTQRKLYDELEVPLIEVLAELEFNGIRLDLPSLKKLGQEMAEQLAEIEQDIHEIAGHEFNIASPKQLRTVLFDELKLSSYRRTGITGEASTDQETLERLAQDHPLPRKVVEHRQIAKLKGTYVDALPELVNPRTGRVHTSFNQTGAITGRLSSSDPNLQNVPVRSEQGRQIRQAFVPEPGWELLTADYSQIELRLLAHFSADADLRRAFQEDKDIHSAVAMQVFHVPEEQVTSDMRRMAKTVNFGVLYGMSAHGLGMRLSIPRGEAAKFIDAYFAQYPKVQEYQTNLLESARTTGRVATILGHSRSFEPGTIRARTHYSQRTQAEREAINMEIQGSAADLLKLAMLNIHRRLKEQKRQARMLLTVHDELVFEVPPEELETVAELVRHEMTTAMQLDVPLKVDVGAGPNWLDVTEIADGAAAVAQREAALDEQEWPQSE